MRGVSLKPDVPACYPPRARWYTNLLFRPRVRLRRRLGLDRLQLSGDLTWSALLLSLAIPGFSFFVFGRRLVGYGFFAAYVLVGILFAAALGFAAGNVAFGLLVSLHGTSIIFLESHLLCDAGFGTRAGLGLGTLVSLWALLYSPALNFAERHWVMPLRLGQRVVVIDRRVAPQALRRGDWVAYNIVERTTWGNENAPRVLVNSGIGLDRVLALPGDTVRFSPEGVWVNDGFAPSLPHMPKDGALFVPEKVWFIWPRLDIYLHCGATEDNVSAALQRTAMVREKQVLGRPFQQWFGRRQLP